MNSRVDVIKTLVDDFGVDPNSRSEVCVYVHGDLLQ